MTAQRADDHERLAGLVAAPLAALVDFLVVGVLVARDRVAHLGVAVSRYETLQVVLLVLVAAALASALLRRRLLLGATLGLQGLGLIDLHFWGFAIPFVALGAWLLARAYRLRAVDPRVPDRTDPVGRTPQTANKRFTPRRSRPAS